MQDVTIYQWLLLALGAVGFLITWTRQAVGITRTIDSIEKDTAKKIDAVKDEFLKKFDEISEKFDEEQRVQDQRYGEVANALRGYIASVEKEMHQIEIWGRDNFVLKADFLNAMTRIESAIQRMENAMREELKGIREDMKNHPPRSQ